MTIAHRKIHLPITAAAERQLTVIGTRMISIGVKQERRIEENWLI